MKKKNLFLCFLLAISSILLFSNPTIKNQNRAYATGVYTVSFNSNGGSPASSQQTNDLGNLTNIPVSTKTNYIFAGWTFYNTNTFITTETEFSADTTVYARWAEKNNIFEISQEIVDSTTYYNITGYTLTNGVTYSAGSNLTSANQIVNAINSNMLSNQPVVLNFDNITIPNDQTLIFNIEDLKISGTLSSNSNNIINYISLTNNSTLTLDNLTLSSYGYGNSLITISESSFNTNISINNSSFVGANIDYAIHFQSSNNSLLVEGEVEHTTSFMTNYLSGLSITFDVDFNETVNSPIVISVPYSADQEIIIHNYFSLPSKISVEADNEFFTAIINSISSGNVYVSTKILTNFDANGGSISSSLPNLYYKSALVSYPNSSNVSKEHYDFAGWFGKLTFSDEAKTYLGFESNTFYFDKLILQNFINAGLDEFEIENIFSTSIDEFETENAFTGYSYDENNENLEFLVIKILCEFGESPTFISKWTDTVYTLSFDTNDGEAISPANYNYGETITLPSNPTKMGYLFAGWFADENLETEFSSTTMPGEDLTIYAKWTVDSFNLTLHPNNGLENESLNVEFGTSLSTINKLSILSNAYYNKTGYTLVGWYVDENFETELTLITMPAESLTVYAKWNVNTYSIHFILDTSDSAPISPIIQPYGTDVSNMKPANPESRGKTFKYWATTENGDSAYVFSTMPAETVYVYAVWKINTYKIKFISLVSTTEKEYTYGETIALPTEPRLEGYSFIGWFTDQTYTESFVFGPMPDSNDTILVYAYMREKETIQIDLSSQIFEISNINKNFSVSSKLQGFVVQYLVDDEWTTNTPTEIGTYDVRIYRAEDSTFKSFSVVIEDAFVITPNTLNVIWISIILFIVFVIEIIACIVIRLMKRFKRNISTLSIVLPFGIIETNQFIMLAVSLALAIFGFVLLVFEIVRLHKTNVFFKHETTVEEEQAQHAKRFKDVSENKNIEKNVDKLLQKEGLTKPNVNQNEENNDFDLPETSEIENSSETAINQDDINE